MRIFVLGTSNSVMTEGYVKALKLKHEVINFSLGRVPCIYHIKVVLEKRKEIENCDILIVEHYINDINHYIKVFGEVHFDYCKDLYEILSCLNVNIINLFYPILGINEHQNNRFYKELLNLSDYYDLETVDLNKLYNEPKYFKDKLHLREDLSFVFGYQLSDILNELPWKTPVGGALIESAYTFLSAKELNIGCENTIKKYTNSLISIDFLDLKNDFYLKMPEASYLVAIGYFKSREECSGLVINNSIIVLSRDGYLVELLDKNINCNSALKIKPLLLKGSYYSLGNRQCITGDFSGAKIVDLIFKTMTKNKVIDAERHKVELSFNAF